MSKTIQYGEENPLRYYAELLAGDARRAEKELGGYLSSYPRTMPLLSLSYSAGAMSGAIWLVSEGRHYEAAILGLLSTVNGIYATLLLKASYEPKTAKK